MKAFPIIAVLLTLGGLSACTPNQDLTTDTPTWPVYGPYPEGMPQPVPPLDSD